MFNRSVHAEIQAAAISSAVLTLAMVARHKSGQETQVRIFHPMGDKRFHSFEVLTPSSTQWKMTRNTTMYRSKKDALCAGEDWARRFDAGLITINDA